MLSFACYGLEYVLCSFQVSSPGSYLYYASGRLLLGLNVDYLIKNDVGDRVEPRF